MLLFLRAALCGAGAAAAAGLNPFYENMETDQGSFFAVRPFCSHTVLEEGAVHDYLWPLYTRKAFKNEETSRALIFWFTHNFAADQQTPRQRRWLLPVWFQGRDAAGESYLALFPFGGTIHEFLGRDRILFALFPLYANSRINEVKTTSVLWPVYSHTRGDGIERDRVFPLYGKSVLEGQYVKRFILWPFWTSARYDYPGESGTSWILFPLCGRGKLEQERTLWLLPPFFRFTDGVKQNCICCPWPFFQKVDSERYNKLYFWPLWGQKQFDEGLYHRTFLLWPFFWSEKTREAYTVRTRRMALPFFYLERERLSEKGVPQDEWVEVSFYWKIWPLMSWQREGTATRFRLLELWPIRNSAPVERNWAPLWTLYKRTEADGRIRRDVLWFAWHSEREPNAERAEWSLLKGLLAYKREGGRRSCRVLYFLRFGE